MTSSSHSPRLLIVGTTFPRWKDDPGPAPFVFHHAKALLEFFEVTVLAPHHKGAALDEDMEGVRVKRFRYAWPDSLELLCDGAGIQNNMRKSLFHRALVLPLLLAELWAVRRELGRETYNYVNSHWIIPSGFLAAVALTGKEARHVVTLHAADFDLLQKIPGGLNISVYVARRATSLVAVSKRIFNGLKESSPAGSKIYEMPMGVNAKLFNFRHEARDKWRRKLGVDDERLILFAGKLSRKKGVEVLLRAGPRIGESGWPHKIVIVGEGELRGNLERLIDELGIKESVLFLGALPNRELAELYSAADVVAVPSVRDEKGETEGMPVVILEALAAGRPVVATRLCSSPPDLVGRGVIEVAEDDPAALAEAVLAALQGEVQVDRSAVDGYDMEQVAKKYVEIFQE